LKRADPVLARIIERVGPCRLERDRNQFGALVKAILYQQLALKAAQTIFRRFRQIYGNPRGRLPRPEELRRTPVRKLRAFRGRRSVICATWRAGRRTER
jgi:DNA-3-methyladenine glycosylase II